MLMLLPVWVCSGKSSAWVIVGMESAPIVISIATVFFTTSFQWRATLLPFLIAHKKAGASPAFWDSI